MAPRTQIPFTFRQLEVFNTVARRHDCNAAVELLSSPPLSPLQFPSLKGLKSAF